MLQGKGNQNSSDSREIQENLSKSLHRSINSGSSLLRLENLERVLTESGPWLPMAEGHNDK